MIIPEGVSTDKGRRTPDATPKQDAKLTMNGIRWDTAKDVRRLYFIHQLAHEQV